MDFVANFNDEERSMSLHKCVHSEAEQFRCELFWMSNQKFEKVQSGENSYRCKISKEIWESEKQRKIHCLQRKFKCITCSKAFTSWANLRIHERIHTGEKPFHCKFCGKNFNQLTNLNNHERTHTGEKPFHCDICDRKFSQVTMLNNHKRLHSGEKPYHCKVCDMKFTQVSNLTSHEKIHANILYGMNSAELNQNFQVKRTPFKCNTCNKAFKSGARLKVHERVHTGEKPFYCLICGKNFSQATSLNNHERVHTGEKPYHCKFCDMKFTQVCNLNSHEKTHAKFMGKVLDEPCVQKVELWKPAKKLKHNAVQMTSLELNHNMRFLNKSLKKKKRFRVREFGCGVCDSVFAKQSSFLKHCSCYLKKMKPFSLMQS